jgi:hypothetical protein
MKTIFTFLALVLLFTSCEKPKDYTCICTITEESMFSSKATTHEEYYTIHNKKRKAVKECDNHEPSGVQVWTKTECSIQ